MQTFITKLNVFFTTDKIIYCANRFPLLSFWIRRELLLLHLLGV